MDSRAEAETRFPIDDRDTIERRAVCFLRVEAPEPIDNRDSDADLEQFEIGIGSWRAKIVKEADGTAGRPRYQARFDAVPREAWKRRRMQRFTDRLNARRRLSD